MERIEDKAKENMYKILYRFLKENGIICEYIANIVKKHKTKGNTKEILYKVVNKYINSYYCSEYPKYSCQNLFNWAPSGFYWSESIEGEDFWEKYHIKWEQFYKKNKEKYSFL